LLSKVPNGESSIGTSSSSLSRAKINRFYRSSDDKWTLGNDQDLRSVIQHKPEFQITTTDTHLHGIEYRF